MKLQCNPLLKQDAQNLRNDNYEEKQMTVVDKQGEDAKIGREPYCLWLKRRESRHLLRNEVEKI
jgi:hypothetical protein